MGTRLFRPEDVKRFFDRLYSMEESTIIEDIFNANHTPFLDRVVDLEMDFFDVMEVYYDFWPNEVQHILTKRGGIDRLRIKDLVKIEQILGYKFIKIEKL